MITYTISRADGKEAVITGWELEILISILESEMEMIRELRVSENDDELYDLADVTNLRRLLLSMKMKK